MLIFELLLTKCAVFEFVILVGTVCFTTNGFIFADNMEPDTNNHTSPRSSSISVPGLADCSLSGGVKTTSEVGTDSPIHPDSEFDVSVNNLPRNLAFWLSSKQS